MKSKSRRKPTAIDLFSGCGGLTQGLKRAGFNVIGAIELDPSAVEVYKLNHSDVTIFEGDIKKLKVRAVCNKLSLEKGKLDLLAGCPPCQGFSNLRTLNGQKVIRDRRNGLLSEFLRFVIELKPRTVMLENVPGLSRTKRFKSFRTKLQTLGYQEKHDILDAAKYSVPQRRNRLIYLAAMGTNVDFGKAGRRRKTVRDAIGGLPRAGKSGDPLHDIPERRSAKVVKRIKSIPKNGGGRQSLPKNQQLNCHKKCNGFKDIYGRMAWDKVAPTITTGCFNPSKGRFLHPFHNRAITMREAALLQGFPKKYKFVASRGKVTVATLIGNALPPPFVASHARSLRSLLERTSNES